MKISVKHFSAFFLIFVCSFIIRAQDTPQQDSSSWNFGVTPYLWMAGVSGDLSFVNQSVPVNAEFKDIVQDLSFAFMLHFEAKKDRWIIMTDLVYLKLDRNGRIELLAIDTAFELKQLIAEVGGGYTIATSGDWFFFDGIAGLRYTGIDNRLDAGQVTLLDNKVNIYDPFLGVRFRTVSEKWLSGARIDMGGFGISSDFSWKTNLYLGYKFSRVFSLLLGLQAYGVDYKDGNFGLDLTTGGAALGFNFQF